MNNVKAYALLYWKLQQASHQMFEAGEMGSHEMLESAKTVTRIQAAGEYGADAFYEEVEKLCL